MLSVNPLTDQQRVELARICGMMISARIALADLSTSMVFNPESGERDRARGIFEETAQTLGILEVGLVPEAGLRQYFPDCFDPEPVFGITQTEADLVAAYITVGFGAATANQNQLREGMSLVKDFPKEHAGQIIACATRMYRWLFTSRGLPVPVPSKLAVVNDRVSKITRGH